MIKRETLFYSGVLVYQSEQQPIIRVVLLRCCPYFDTHEIHIIMKTYAHFVIVILVQMLSHSVNNVIISVTWFDYSILILYGIFYF